MPNGLADYTWLLGLWLFALPVLNILHNCSSSTLHYCFLSYFSFFPFSILFSPSVSLLCFSYFVFVFTNFFLSFTFLDFFSLFFFPLSLHISSLHYFSGHHLHVQRKCFGTKNEGDWNKNDFCYHNGLHCGTDVKAITVLSAFTSIWKAWKWSSKNSFHFLNNYEVMWSLGNYFFDFPKIGQSTLRFMAVLQQHHTLWPIVKSVAGNPFDFVCRGLIS